jgi:uncharacterized protein YjbI with pentapeptide repeats
MFGWLASKSLTTLPKAVFHAGRVSGCQKLSVTGWSVEQPNPVAGAALAGAALAGAALAGAALAGAALAGAALAGAALAGADVDGGAVGLAAPELHALTRRLATAIKVSDLARTFMQPSSK